MPTRAKRQVRRPPRSVRSDGAWTRGHILEVAGRIYAEKGRQRTTSREICAAAGTNLAAVNYHFGSKDALYDAVLVEAHGQLVKLDDLEAIANSADGAQARLRALIALFAGRPAGRALPWGLRVLVHELLVAPSPHVAALMQKAVLPKVKLMQAIVADVLEFPPDHPAVQRALALVVLPCIMMVIAPRQRLRQALPALAADPQALVDDMGCYALAGLAAIARRHRAAGVGSD
jgi:TetR/AcrR family transcriptional regulator, regulator of cefoperazone and chloramphenicol sensitivity